MQNKINTTNKHLHRNSIFTILFVVILILVSSINTIPSNAAKATYITKNKKFTISGCASESDVQLFCQVDANENLSGIISGQLRAATHDVDTGKSAAKVTWKKPAAAGGTALGGTIECSYHSSTSTWTINMVNVNCFTYTPYIICNAGTKTGYTSTSVSTIAGTGTKEETGVNTNGDYDIVDLSYKYTGSNTFKVYIGAGFADKGFNFNWVANTYYVTYNGNGATSGVPSKQAFTYNSGAKISSAVPVRTGYTFVRWDFNGTKFNPGERIPGDWGSFTLNAVWTPNPYTITTQHMKYNPETKDWELWKTTTETANYDTTYTVKYIPPETGYFEYMKDNNFTVKGNTTVQAKYHPKTYNLKLDYAGGLDKDDKVSTTDTITWIYGTGEGTDISDYTLNKDGYTFNGWYIDDTKVYDINDLIVKGTEFFNNEGKCILDSVNGKYFNLTAHWTANKYNIKFDYNYSELGYETDEEAQQK